MLVSCQKESVRTGGRFYCAVPPLFNAFWGQMIAGFLNLRNAADTPSVCVFILPEALSEPNSL